MRIAIIGTRGIPNNYGGFEQLAQYLSLGLKERGHEVFVYNQHKHFYREKTWKGINIIHKYDPEKIGTAGQFIYDLNCILDSRKRNYDVILNLGYTSSSIWMKLFPSSSRVITNMDGLEWKRSKYNKPVRRFLKFAEGLAVRHSNALVADSVAIQKYLKEQYGAESEFIAYGADIFDKPDSTVLSRFGVEPFSYNMLIARMEPENNIEMILDGVMASTSKARFFVIGNPKNKFGAYLTNKYAGSDKIVFTGPNYDSTVINNLRYYSNLYFHGHSVGGTNPSLLEAMGCCCPIAAHRNEFNAGVLGTDAFYFSSVENIRAIIDDTELVKRERERFVKNNLDKIKNNYSWAKIVDAYEKMMTGNKK